MRMKTFFTGFSAVLAIGALLMSCLIAKTELGSANTLG